MDRAAALHQRDASITEAVRGQRGRLLDYIRRRVRTEQDAEDILQDVLLQLAASYNVAEPIEQITAWLFTVARNKVIDWYRKRKPQSLPIMDEGPLNLEQILFDPAQNPDVVFARSLVWTELAEALDELPEEQRDVFIMHELQGMSFKEIAQSTGVPLNTLLSRKRYAVLFLRDRLQELYNEFETP